MGGITVAAYVEELGYAAGAGAAHIATSVTASGNLQAKTGVVASMPGPGLRTALARSQGGSRRGTTATTGDRVPKIADRMAKSALNQGADLLSGKQ